MATNLTEKYIKAARPASSVQRLRDSIEPGLCLVVAPSGTKTFSFQFTSPEVRDLDRNGKQRMRYGKPLYKRPFMKIGTYPDTSLKAARLKAHDLRQMVDSGVDPIEEAKRQEGSDDTAGTVADLFDLYRRDLEKDGKATKDMLDAYKLDIEPFIGSRQAASITKHDIVDVLGVIVERGSIRKADIVRGYLMRAFNLGIEAETSVRWRKKYAGVFDLDYNPVAVVKKAGASKPGNRVLSNAEVRRLWNETGTNIMRKDTALAIKLILSTGQRVQEVLNAEWKEFDLDEGVWSIPFERRKIRHKAKHSEPQLMPLSSLHIELLTKLKKISGSSQYLFPNADGGAPRTYNSLHLAVKRYCHPGEKAKREPFDHFSPRDLRRTFKTLSGKAGLSKEIRDRLQGHAFQDVGSKNYDRYDYWIEKQAAMATWARWLDNVVKGQKANVVLMKEAS